MLNAIEDNLDKVDPVYHSLYTERNGKFELTGITGMRTQGDIDRLQTALAKERSDHAAVRERFRPLESFGDVATITSNLNRIPELETAAGGKLDEAAIEKVVEGRIKQRIAPIERERDSLTQQVTTLTGEVTTLRGASTQRTIDDAIRQAATKAGIRPEAMDDALMFGERMFEVDSTGRIITKETTQTPGLDPFAWLTDMQRTRPHWWPESVGGGASGSRGSGGGATNPFLKANWNMSEQGRLYRENPERAQQLATQAGTTIGGQPVR